VITYYEPLVAPGPSPDHEALALTRAKLLGDDAATWSEHTLRALEQMHPSIRTKLTGIHLHRWGHAMIRPVPGLLFGDELALARAPIGRLIACATDVAGLPLFEEAFYSALTGADWAIERLAGVHASP
jgi:hypothetical protein